MLQLPTKPEQTNKQELLATATLDVRGMKCAGCVNAVERQLTQNTGVVSACVNLITEVAVVEYEQGVVEPEKLAEKLTSTGFTSQVRPAHSTNIGELTQNAASRREEEKKKQITELAIAAILLIFSGLGHLAHIGGPSIPIISNTWFHWGLATIALFIPGGAIIVDGWKALRHLMPNMNTLVGIGTLSAYFASCVALLFPQLGWSCFFDEPVMLLGFILLGRTLEGRARSRAGEALEALVALQPQLAHLLGKPSLAEQTGIEIPVEQVKVGEWVKVLPGEKIPVDGEVVEGETTVDESMLTGESLPVGKKPGEIVSAGTINQSGAIAIEVTRTGRDTTLAQIIASVEEAQTRKAPIQKLADTVAGYFAYGVMAIASLTFLFWQLIGTRIWPEVLTANSMDMSGEMSMSTSPMLLTLKLTISVLVIACPCALGLATPTAILVGTGIGAERGLLIKGGDILERVHQLDTIVFDKTGTITVGKPTVTDCLPWHDAISSEELLQLAATVEIGTNHPLATAIVEAAKEKEIPILEAKQFYTEAGLGVAAEIDGKQVCLGNKEWISNQKAINFNSKDITQTKSLAESGKTVVYVAVNGELIGIIALKDKLRPDAKEAVTNLQKLGLEVVLLTGDEPIIAEAIGKQIGIEQIVAQVKPVEKATIIQSKQENQGKIVAMVGDGINDAPALAQADIGISLHGSTQVAMETAGIVLMKDRLLDVVEAIKLSRATFQKIQQNLFWALGYNTIAIPIAAGILLPSHGIILNPPAAGGLMALSSIIVVTNSILLRRQFPK